MNEVFSLWYFIGFLLIISIIGGMLLYGKNKERNFKKMRKN